MRYMRYRISLPQSNTRIPGSTWEILSDKEILHIRQHLKIHNVLSSFSVVYGTTYSQCAGLCGANLI